MSTTQITAKTFLIHFYITTDGILTATILQHPPFSYQVIFSISFRFSFVPLASAPLRLVVHMLLFVHRRGRFLFAGRVFNKTCWFLSSATSSNFCLPPWSLTSFPSISASFKCSKGRRPGFSFSSPSWRFFMNAVIFVASAWNYRPYARTGLGASSMKQKRRWREEFGVHVVKVPRQLSKHLSSSTYVNNYFSPPLSFSHSVLRSLWSAQDFSSHLNFHIF